MAALALEYGADEEEAIAALLHDAAEDGGGEATLAEIRARFGDTVGDIVLGCSDSLVEDPEDKLPWRSGRKTTSRTSRTRARRCAWCRRPTSCTTCDRSSATTTSTATTIWDRFQGRREGTLWYYETVADTLIRRHRSQLTRDLQDEVDKLLKITNNE